VPRRTRAGDALTDLVLPAFELNGELLAAAEDMTRPVGLTPAWWQVLGATLTEPLPVAEIARRVGLGLARQSVQRVADILVARGWATYSENPAHRRAKLVAPTQAGREAVASLAEAQHAWANAVGAAVGEEELRRALATMRQIIGASRAYRQEIDAATEAAALGDERQAHPGGEPEPEDEGR
jgi:DNA-binding MarR family transcriptional regulator